MVIKRVITVAVGLLGVCGVTFAVSSQQGRKVGMTSLNLASSTNLKLDAYLANVRTLERPEDAAVPHGALRGLKVAPKKEEMDLESVEEVSPVGDSNGEERRLEQLKAELELSKTVHRQLLLAEDEADTEDQAGGCDVSDLCKLERAGDPKLLEAVFLEYEARADRCGEHEVIETLGQGYSGSTKHLVTPCGTHYTAKHALDVSQVNKAPIQHVEVDCAILKVLSTKNKDPRCNGCFPQYYSYSKDSNTCYMEIIDPAERMSLKSFAKTIDLDSADGITTAKRLFEQAINALEILNETGVIHRDLQAQNMLVKKHTDGTFQLVIIDFCWSKWAPSPHHFKIGGAHLGRFTRTPDFLSRGYSDTYAFACAFADLFHEYVSEEDHLKDKRSFCLTDKENRDDDWSLGTVISRMTQRHKEDRVNDFDEMRKLVDKVTRK